MTDPETGVVPSAFARYAPPVIFAAAAVLAGLGVAILDAPKAADWVRHVGGVMQLSGLALAAVGIVDVRHQLGRSPLTAQLAATLTRERVRIRRLVDRLGRRQPRIVSAQADPATTTVTASTGAGEVWHGMGGDSPHNLIAIKRNVEVLERRTKRTREELDRERAERRAVDDRERADREQAVARVERLVRDLRLGGLRLEGGGLALIAAGIIATTWPAEIGGLLSP